MKIQRVWGVFNRYFRSRRMALFYARFGVTEQTRILDIGGCSPIWMMMEVRPKLLLVNVKPEENCPLPQVIADGCKLPFGDGEFDIAFSNSVIEHVGDTDAQLAFANEVRRVARHYWVQTPNRWFPIEPHYVAPFIHWFPKSWRLRLARYTVWGLLTKPTPERCRRMVDSIWLLGPREMKKLFPGAVLIRERFAGLSKSLIVTG
ncbi:MAG: methyltransferase domain-containing protein [Terracidiphilus sp.]